MANRLNNIESSPFLGLDSFNITSYFGERELYNTKINKHIKSNHKGIDLIGGNEICATSNGKVVEVRDGIKGYSEKYTYGNYVTIYHGNGIHTTYAHMKYHSIKVKIGDFVKKGDAIGIIGETGYALGVHLHYEISEDGIPVNPLDYLLGNKTLPSFEERANSNTQEKVDSNSQFDKYLIKKGDTLSRIALNYNTTYSYLAKINNIDNPNLIIAGTYINVPKTIKDNIYHVVKRGDNLSKIAQKYNTTWQTIYNNNKEVIGNNPNLIKVGQILKI